MKRQNLIFYFILAILSVITISRKDNYACDEISSFELANFPVDYYIFSSDSLYHPAQGKCFFNEEPYSPPSSLWNQVLSAHKDHCFDYKNVFSNQAIDVHPPFYYCILHTICSFTPHKHSIWQGEIINLLFILATLFALQLLASSLISNRLQVSIILAFFAISPAILDSVVLIRMYIVAMFFVVIISYLFVELFSKNDCSWKNLVILSFCSILGSLTHYYVTFFIVVTTISFVIVAVIDKQYRKCIIVGTVMIISGLISVTIFPSMIDHVFGTGVHGVNAKSEILNIANFKHRLHLFFSMLDASIFGFLSIGIIVSVLLSGCYQLIKNKGNVFFLYRFTISKWAIVIIPTLLYFVTISKTASYIAIRYMNPIFPLIILLGISSLYYSLQVIKNSQIQLIATLLVLSSATISAYNYAYWGNLCKMPEDQERLFNSTMDGIVAYKGDCPWVIYNAYNQTNNLKSLSFCSINDLPLIVKDSNTYMGSTIYNRDSIILFIDYLTSIEEITTKLPPNTIVDSLAKHDLVTSYIVRRNSITWQ